jgi:hypothetical protein
MNEIVSLLLRPLSLIVIVATAYYCWKHRAERKLLLQSLRTGAFVLLFALAYSWQNDREFEARIRSVAEQYKVSNEEAKQIIGDAADDEADRNDEQ